MTNGTPSFAGSPDKTAISSPGERGFHSTASGVTFLPCAWASAVAGEVVVCCRRAMAYDE